MPTVNESDYLANVTWDSDSQKIYYKDDEIIPVSTTGSAQRFSEYYMYYNNNDVNSRHFHPMYFESNLEVFGSYSDAPHDITFTFDHVSITGSNTSSECPFSYRLYINPVVNIIDGSTVYQKRLEIKRDIAIVYDERVTKDTDYTRSYAMSIMQFFIDDCMSNLKIKTTCCLLVCCEPDKYELI